MTVTKEGLDILQDQAKVTLSDSELQYCQEAFIMALELAESLEKVDTTDVEPMISPLELINVMREDEVKPGLDKEEALALSAQKEAGCFKIPRIL